MAAAPHKQSGHRTMLHNLRKNNVTFLSQNVRGIKSNDRIEELVQIFATSNAFAACLQETWRFNKEQLELGEFRLVTSGLNRENQNGKRGSQGVGILLSPDGVVAWNAAGMEMHTDLGARLIAIRLLLKDHQKRDVGVFLVSAYAPVGNAPEENWTQYLDLLSLCIDRKRRDDILIIGSDCNSSMGCSRENDGSPLGQYGIPHVNMAGKRLLTYISINELMVATTRFEKSSFGTWCHPRSKKQHQIDHFLINHQMLHRCTDAGIAPQLLDSDHRTVFIKLRVMKRLRRKSDPRQLMCRLDYSKLDDPNFRNSFCQDVISKFNAENTDDHTYSNLSSSITSTAISTLPKKRNSQPGWFELYKNKLMPLIKKRNSAMENMYRRWTRSSSNKLKLARKALKNCVKTAKNAWTRTLIANIASNKGTKQSWDAINCLKSGLAKLKPSTQRLLKRPDGTICQTAEQNAEVFSDHFSNLFGRIPTYDETVLNLLPQHPTFDQQSNPPSDLEITTAIKKLKNNAPGETGIPASVWKCFAQEPTLFNLLRDIIINFWSNEIVPAEWDIGRLIVLPKKGDLSLPKNYRGITLLESAYKIVAIIIHTRLLPIQESLPIEPQCGFRPGRGCMDAIFTMKSAVRKRREHGQESWILFLDLVKAFDRVPRELLWSVLSKLGVPDKVIRLLKALHVDYKVKFTVDGVTKHIQSIVGVKQGDILGPILFTFLLAAIMISWNKVCNIPVCVFRTKEDLKLTGRNFRATGEDLPLQDSEYADDTGLIFANRNDITIGSRCLLNHFASFGMEVHTGAIEPRTASKTEILFCPKPLSLYQNPETYDDTDLSDILIDDYRYLPIVDFFPYLGSIISSDTTDVNDVTTRITKAGNAFGALRKCIFASTNVRMLVLKRISLP